MAESSDTGAVTLSSGAKTEDMSIFQGPQCLIDSKADGKLFVNAEVLQQFNSIEEPLNVVAIAGLYRTGKSYLMNRLAGKYQGFALGYSVQSKTKGIWVWCVPHPIHRGQVLALLDTEGLGDIEKGAANHDNSIFALVTLLSSTLVYNMFGVFDQHTLEKLNFITEISKNIKTKDDESGSKNFDCFFPMFVVALRDFSVELKIDGREVDSDEYLEHCLELRTGTDDISLKVNDAKRCIRRFYKDRKCFTFDRPGGKKILLELDSLKDADLSEDFVDDTKKFCDFIHKHCPPKKLDTGMPVRGTMFATLVSTYVEAIRNGAIPCIENALNTMAILENTKAEEQGVKLYLKQMNDTVDMPTETFKEMSEAHQASVKEAVAHFLKHAIYDTDNKFQEKMNFRINEEYENLKRENMKISSDNCRDKLAALGEFISKKLEKGLYMCAGGYTDYQADLHKLQIQYECESSLGLKKHDEHLEFLNKKWAEAQSILAADKKVSEEEKKAEDERQKALEAQRQKEITEKEAKLKEEHAKDKERMMTENIHQLEKRRVEDMKNVEKHHQDVMHSRLVEQQRTLEEGFKKESDHLREEFRNFMTLKERSDASMKKESDHIREEFRKFMTLKERSDASMKKETDELREDIRRRNACFADTSVVKVRLVNGEITTKILADLNIGDSVESFDFETGNIAYSPVYFITHYGENIGAFGYDMVFLKLGEGESTSTRERGIRLDGSHLLYVTKPDEEKTRIPRSPIIASEVVVGDLLWVKSGDTLVPQRVTDIQNIKAGIRHPMTMNHVIIVDGVLASVHMHHETLYRALTSPLRILYSLSPSLVGSGFVREAVNAWDYVENFL